MKHKLKIYCAVAAIIIAVQQNYSDKIRTNQQGLELIGNAEGCLKTPYQCPADVLTVGIGSTAAGGEPIDPQKIYSEEEIAERWIKDIKIAEKCVNQYFNGKKMNDNQFAAMTSAAFNLGCQNLRFYRSKEGQQVQTTINKYAVSQKFNEMCKRLTDFTRSGGKILDGLVKRRNAEKMLCLTKAGVI